MLYEDGRTPAAIPADCAPPAGAPAGHWHRVGDETFERLVGRLWRIEGGDASATYGLETESRHENGSGVVHGGVLATFADHALGLTVRSAHALERQATIQLDLRYMGPVQPGAFVVAACEIRQVTRSLCFIDATLSAEGRTAVTATGIWKMSGKTPTGGGSSGA